MRKLETIQTKENLNEVYAMDEPGNGGACHLYNIIPADKKGVELELFRELDDNRIIPNRPYVHFKDNLYYVHDIVEDSEMKEKMVYYQALYSPYKKYVRSLEMFKSKIGADREGNTTGQEYRFELYGGRD